MPNKPQNDEDELSEGMGPAKPGGVYEDAPGAGTFHDAHNRPVSKDGKLLAGDQIPGAVNAQEDEAWRKDMEQQRKASADASKDEMAKGRAQSSDLSPGIEGEDATPRRGRR